MKAVHQPVASLVDELTDPNHGASRPVIDKTGLAGFYDFEIQWSPELTAGSDAAPGTGAPSVFVALQEQLGLRLEPAISRFDTVVIDRAEKPFGKLKRSRAGWM